MKSITELALMLIEAKQVEADAKARRKEIEYEMYSLSKGETAEGVENIERDGVRVKITHKITRTLDEDVWDEIKGSVSASSRAVVTYKATIDLKTLREIQKHRPDDAKIIARAITEKTAKPSFSAEILEVK